MYGLIPALFVSSPCVQRFEDPGPTCPDGFPVMVMDVVGGKSRAFTRIFGAPPAAAFRIYADDGFYGGSRERTTPRRETSPKAAGLFLRGRSFFSLTLSSLSV